MKPGGCGIPLQAKPLRLRESLFMALGRLDGRLARIPPSWLFCGAVAGRPLLWALLGVTTGLRPCSPRSVVSSIVTPLHEERCGGLICRTEPMLLNGSRIALRPSVTFNIRWIGWPPMKAVLVLLLVLSNVRQKKCKRPLLLSSRDDGTRVSTDMIGSSQVCSYQGLLFRRLFWLRPLRSLLLW